MLQQQSNFLIVVLILFLFIFISYLVLPFMKKTLPKINGTVIKGTGQTTPYGFPTANMKITKKLKNGIYEGRCKYGKVTVYSEDNFCVKCYIHDFSKNILGELLHITNLKFVSPFSED